MLRALIRPQRSADRASDRPADDWRAQGVCLFLVIAVAMVFGRSLGYGFSSLDDGIFVGNEPHVNAGLTWSGVRWAFTSGPLGEWYPLSMLSHMLDCQYYGLKPAGHHLTNLLLHAAAAVTLFLVLCRMTGELWASALVAALFAVHPLHVESVVWIAERRDVLSGFFFMLTLGAYGEYVRRPRSIGRYLAVVGFFALGLLAKPMLVTVPALLLLLDFWPLKRFRRVPQEGTLPPASCWPLVLEKLPLLALAIGTAVVTRISHHSGRDVLTMPDRVAGAVVSLVAYLGQLFVPVGLSVFYGYPEAGWPAWQIAAAAALLLAITTAAVIGRRSYPYLFVGWFWYVGMLVPVLGLVYVGPHARADRYTYLSQIGLYIALVWGAKELAARWPARRWLFGAVSLSVLVVLMACAWRQTGFWQSPAALWEHAVACDPENPLANYRLGAGMLARRDYAGAARHFRQAVEMKPSGRNLYGLIRAQAHEGLALIAAEKKDDAGAVDHYAQAVELDPDFAPTRVGLAEALATVGKLDEAIVQLRRSVEPQRSGGVASFDRALDLARQGKVAEALANFGKAFDTDSALGRAQMKVATTLAERLGVDKGHRSISPSD